MSFRLSMLSRNHPRITRKKKPARQLTSKGYPSSSSSIDYAARPNARGLGFPQKAVVDLLRVHTTYHGPRADFFGTRSWIRIDG